MPNAGIEVEGLRETAKAVKALDPELAKSLKVAFTKVAEVVADAARAKVPTRSGRARSSVRAGADTKGPYVAGGKKAVPYYGWLDFGSRSPVKGHPRAYGPWFKSGVGPKRGRFIYPALDAHEQQVIEGAEAALATAREAAGI